MHHMLAAARRIVNGEDGQDLVEYGLLAGLIAIFAMTGVTALGATIQTVFWDVIARGF